jgi:ornithine cyclodeaminase/alanine dehydrogenase-like protein (mu-crystallin family)
MPDLIEAMGRALGDYSAGRAVQPVRSVLEIGPEKNYFGVMPAAVGSAVGAKLVTVYHENHARGLPSHLATIVLMDPASGELIAILDGRYITEARTAAVSAVSVKHLASRGASVLALIGSGVQARSHLEAIRHVANLTDVRVWSPNAFHRDQFAKDASAETSLTVRATPDARSAIRGADIVVLATASREPVIANDDVAPGAHIVGVGACRPDQREMPTPLIARARVYVDSRQGALKEAGDLLIPIREGAVNDRHIVGELGELVSGKVAGRIAASGVTVFKSLGMAVEDVVAAQLALERAKAAGLGQSIEFR